MNTGHNKSACCVSEIGPCWMIGSIPASCSAAVQLMYRLLIGEHAGVHMQVSVRAKR